MTNETLRTIVCAIDLSEASRCALDTAIELYEKLGPARLHVVYVREREERIENLKEFVEQEEAEELKLQREVDGEIAHVAGARGGAPTVEVEIRYGKAYREILHYALDVHADIIVVGTHGRTGLGHAILGSVAERVVRHAPCNVVVAKSPQARAHLAQIVRPAP